MNKKHSDESVKIEVDQKESLGKDEDLIQADVDEGIKPLDEMTTFELIDKIKELQDESEKNYDKFLRAQAEIDNILKRNKKEKEDWIKYSNETLIKDILPVIDNLELAIAHSKNENALNALSEGVELTLKGLRDTLSRSGLKEVKAEGESFDPCFHHAVSQQEDENTEAGTIINELQKGYTLHERLIRPAMVVLSKGNQNNKENNIDKVCKE